MLCNTFLGKAKARRLGVEICVQFVQFPLDSLGVRVVREFSANKLSCEHSSYQEILEVVMRKFPEEAEEVLVSHGEPWFFHGNKDAHASQTALSVATHTRTP